EPFHRGPLPLDSVMGLVYHRASHWHLRVCEHRVPAGLLLLKAVSHARAIGRSYRGGDVVHKVAQAPAQRTHAQAFALACSVEQGWNWVCKALRTGEAMAASFPGSLLSAWRRQWPRRAPEKSVRMLLVG